MADPIAQWLEQDPSDAGEVAARYDAWAESYDHDLASWSYRAPAVVVDTLLERLPSVASVLDVGCGTGLVGRELRARGFSGHLRGLDLSEASLAVARGTGAYDVLEPADLQQPLPVDDDAAEAVLCVGVMTYLPEVEAVWRELVRVAGSRGLVVLTQREDLWESRDCQGVVDRIQAEGRWTLLDLTGPAPYLPQGYGGGDAVGCYYLTAEVL